MKRLVWSKRKPTVPGQWWRETSTWRVIVVEIDAYDIAIRFKHFSQGGRWAGPLPMPEEAHDERR